MKKIYYTHVQAKKDLIFEDGKRSFTKGKKYRLYSPSAILDESLFVQKNNQSQPHFLGKWVKHFKLA